MWKKDVMRNSVGSKGFREEKNMSSLNEFPRRGRLGKENFPRFRKM